MDIETSNITRDLNDLITDKKFLYYVFYNFSINDPNMFFSSGRTHWFGSKIIEYINYEEYRQKMEHYKDFLNDSENLPKLIPSLIQYLLSRIEKWSIYDKKCLLLGFYLIESAVFGYNSKINVGNIIQAFKEIYQDIFNEKEGPDWNKTIEILSASGFYLLNSYESKTGRDTYSNIKLMPIFYSYRADLIIYLKQACQFQLVDIEPYYEKYPFLDAISSVLKNAFISSGKDSSIKIQNIKNPNQDDKLFDQSNNRFETDRLNENRTRKLKQMVKVSKSLKMSQMSLALHISEEELYDHIFDWAEQFGFQLDQDVVIFSGGNVDAFMDLLDTEFKNWNDNEIKTIGKK